MKPTRIHAFVLGLAVALTPSLRAQDDAPERPDPRPMPPEIEPGPGPSISPYAGGYPFAAVDLRGENKTAGVGFIKVGRGSAFRGHIRNHESGKVARFAGKVLRTGKLEFIPDFDNVRHNIRILRKRGCVHGLTGRYLIRKADEGDGGDDPGTDPPSGEDTDGVSDEPGADDGDTPDISDVIRSAGVVVGFRR